MRSKISFAILAVTSLSACNTPAVVPAWNGKIYQGDHVRQSVRRAQENEEIFTNDPRFSHGKWISDEDFKSFYNTFVLGCAQWKDTVRVESIEQAVSNNPEVLQEGRIEDQ